MGLIRLGLPTTDTHTHTHTHTHTRTHTRSLSHSSFFLTDCPSDYKLIAGGDSATEDMPPSCLQMWKGRNHGKLASISFQCKWYHSLPAPISRALQKWKQAQAWPEGRLNYYSCMKPVRGNSTEHPDWSPNSNIYYIFGLTDFK